MQSRRRQILSEIGFEDEVNASLWFDKFMPDDEGVDKAKQKLVSEITKVKVPEIYKSKFEQWKMMLKGVGAKTKVLRVDQRMIIGLGGESVLETSIKLHRVYGVPFIPGSALKGLAASYAHRHLSSGWKRGEKLHNLVFGSQDFAGLVKFYDAMLIPNGDRLPLHKEIMTVHHSEYYGDSGKPPADWDDPVPILFVSASGSYLVALSCEKGLEKVLDRVFEILALAFEEEGIGAKTSSGYGRGRFEKSEDEVNIEKENIEVEKFISRVSALRSNEVAGQIYNFYLEWKNSPLSDESRRKMAQAIIEKIRSAGREKKSQDKQWYMELLSYLTK
ncbi:MAG: type III-B CRISPR module RAMP protein Cmr6 [Acidobacteriota bacterium]|nr:type III-B CRISPR module RAMP protein Cmr6 [Acidobacteriota bacterium]